ncbi:MAG: 2Fe-2S iron-sulfur cluster binding domain-containing protein [Nitrospiraceae bacterium]|nr:2Fe-2S iron-sulfur cluster binding domain-containing protein [Nitrospiraceae bacterium]
MHRVTFQQDGMTYDAEEGQWLYDVCEAAGASVPFACKAGACGTCATQVVQGEESLGPQRAREIRTLESNGLDPTQYRLLCLADVHGTLTLGASAKTPQATAALGLYKVRVEAYRPYTLTVCEQRFAVESGEITFSPGQYMIFHVPGIDQVIRRSYSISSSPSDKTHFEICVRAVSGGFCSNFIHRLRPGDIMQVEGPYGDFRLHDGSQRDLLMIATGTGIAPIKSMLLSLLGKPGRRRIRLFFGLRNVSDLFYTKMLSDMSERYPWFEPTIILSQPDPVGWPGFRGRVTDLIREQVSLDEASHTDAYLCGGRPMIEDAKRLLIQKGMSVEQIRHENFF